MKFCPYAFQCCFFFWNKYSNIIISPCFLVFLQLSVCIHLWSHLRFEFVFLFCICMLPYTAGCWSMTAATVSDSDTNKYTRFAQDKFFLEAKKYFLSRNPSWSLLYWLWLPNALDRNCLPFPSHLKCWEVFHIQIWVAFLVNKSSF